MTKEQRKTALIFFPAFDWAISPTHPEREERLLYTQDQIFEEGLLDLENIHEYKPGIASVNDINRAHICVPDAQSVITESHLISAGGAMAAADKVFSGHADNAFALVRPPGHHAMRVVHGARGFCNINIEAVMIEYCRKKYGINKIAVVDTDCHHGDGTQDIYWHDPNVLCISIHQDGRTLYPGTGFQDEMGGPNAFGATINVPLPPRTSDEGFLYVLENLVMPVLDDFKPELIINSAGQDNHFTDPITDMRFSAQGYARLTEILQPHIAVLEGGYSIEGALPYVNLGIILAMAGLDYSQVREPEYDAAALRQSDDISRYIKKLTKHIMDQWKEREALREKLIGASTWIERVKNIYYDTDGISERQVEKVRICNDCGGLVAIESTADTGNTIFAVIVPVKGCQECRQQARDLYRQSKKGEYRLVYFQDNDKELFLVK